MYTDVSLFIDGEWTAGTSGKSEPILNPATGKALARLHHAGIPELDRALAAADKGFKQWKAVSPFERYKVLRKAANLMRERADEIAQLMTLEQGKPLAEAKMEALSAGDLIDWFAEEARRTYGQIVPPRAEGVSQLVIKEPVGPVAAFTPWNFPINQAVRKVSAALAAGCSVILKGPEETPASCAALVRAYADAGVPAGVINLVFGVPSEISEYLIPHPVIRKITFTGSTPVGKKLAALAGQHMKRITMELGGHAPAIVFDDADVASAAKQLAGAKFRNAGQVCVSPTRFLVHESVYPQFVDGFVAAASQIKVGDGLQKDTRMGPLANSRRVEAMQQFVDDAVAKGAKVALGGKRGTGDGYFFEPTVLTDLPADARILHEEPFGPIAPILPFKTYDEVVAEANRLPFGLAAYAFTRSLKTATAIGSAIESGMVSINHFGLALPEVPFGGIKDSGYGTEGGSDAINAYLNAKFVTQTGL
ncbi:NAD-dependent succinate-semialdehyde dehydrogenase [Piscinibacter sp. HJYY11]|uniref:NAD-dependent succinate-semialdehyde dehydrogenase n=1 Tax=Piscinibacter sp. HJYY11 TaxID=2801333 RepID=UPI00191D0402|nr:NAD-dependent succinate-semialdehyde dehydrogenase [Piscinibacter sp. HJYY11]MBL0729739.1 NAD-dependent succinate-semialdehyde dehydrogenase [Piscinibacter sp. HJYY11]